MTAAENPWGGAAGPGAAPPPANNPGPAAGGPQIADRSYRDYDGPLNTRAARWWVVALATIRANVRKPAFWIPAALVALSYVIQALFLYIFRQQIEQFGEAAGVIPGQQTIFRDTLWRGLTWTWLPLFLVALVAGAGSLAADNRANALLVYLSKPITKTDYLVGKWVGVFVLLALVSVVPAVLTFLFMAAAYNSEGFLRDNPWLFPRLLGATLLPAFLHASIVIGLSAWSKSPRIVGATYAGLFFVTLIVSDAAGFLLLGNLDKNNPQADTRPAFLAQSVSVPGLVNNAALHLYNVEPQPFGQGRRRNRRGGNAAPPPPGLFGMGGGTAYPLRRPPLAPLLALAGVLIVVPVLAARARIRAVEVVSG